MYKNVLHCKHHIVLKMKYFDIYLYFKMKCLNCDVTF